MALDPTSVPCSLLSTSGGFSNLFIPSTLPPANAYPLIVNDGTLRTYSSALNGTDPFTGVTSVLSSDILASPSTGSSYRLVQFLSGGGVAAADKSKNYNYLKYVALSATPGSGSSSAISSRA